MGVVQKGRSRTWLDDHGWWLGVVEFQPSSWSRGSYLNVGVMWLWRPGDDHYVYFELGHRVEGLVVFESEDQFEPEARRLATRAADELQRYRSAIPDLAAAAKILRREAMMRRGWWPRWDAALAHALLGEHEEAARLFRKVAESGDDRPRRRPLKEAAARLGPLVHSDPGAVTREAVGWIEDYRAGLRLPPLDPATLRGG